MVIGHRLSGSSWLTFVAILHQFSTLGFPSVGFFIFAKKKCCSEVLPCGDISLNTHARATLQERELIIKDTRERERERESKADTTTH